MRPLRINRAWYIPHCRLLQWAYFLFYFYYYRVRCGYFASIAFDIFLFFTDLPVTAVIYGPVRPLRTRISQIWSLIWIYNWEHSIRILTRVLCVRVHNLRYYSWRITTAVLQASNLNWKHYYFVDYTKKYKPELFHITICKDTCYKAIELSY